MVDVEELKKHFTVEGESIIIPAHLFNDEWDQELLDKGYECHPRGNKIVVTPFNPTLPEPPAKSKPWTQEEEDRLIELWNTKDKTKDEIAKEFPDRAQSSVSNKLGRLRNAGKIEPRWRAQKTKKRLEEKSPEEKKREMRPHICLGAESCRLMGLEVQALSEFDKQVQELHSEFMRISAFGRAGSDKEFAELAQRIQEFTAKWETWWNDKKEKMLLKYSEFFSEVSVK